MPVVCALGDLLLDVVVKLSRPLADGDDTHGETRAGAGGQAANVAAWAAALGARARFIGKRGADGAGELVEADLLRRAVDVLGPPPVGRNGVVVSLVDVDGNRTMVSDRGVAPQLAPVEIQAEWFEEADWLHLSGYSLMGEPIGSAAERAVLLAREAGARVSVDLSSVNLIREFGRDVLAERFTRIRPDVVFGNEAEHEELPLPSDIRVVKRGPRGATIDGRDLPPTPGEVLDTTGAGDALAAGYLVGGPELAMEAAARCVAQLGTMP
ncbi:MAG TPA: PfkB family carbohydrate kinase [Gaiellaceae bacterium]|nr:PfkB family carbohydrate kinase [Gaiellaceae bacterium]HET8653239.1 PfkB family carbohydrate kinase [Gaiellaceae bacterium]